MIEKDLHHQFCEFENILYSIMVVGTKDLRNKRNYTVKFINKTPAQGWTCDLDNQSLCAMIRLKSDESSW